MLAKKILAILFILFSISAPAAEISIISSHSKLTYAEAVDIFTFNNFTFSNGEKVRMIVLPMDTYTTRTFAYSLGMTSIRFFERAETAFSVGKLNLLVVVDSDKDVIRMINSNTGSIGYVQSYFILNNSGIPSVISVR